MRAQHTAVKPAAGTSGRKTRGAIRGTAPMFLARVTAGAATVAMFAALARLLEVDDFGLFAFAWSSAFILGSLAEAGYGMLVIRSVAQRPTDAGRYMGALVPVRLAATIIAVLAGAGLGWLTIGPFAALVLAVATLSACLQLTAQTGRDFMIPAGLYGVVGAFATVENVVRAVVVVAAAAMTESVLWALVASVAAYGASVTGTLYFVVRRLRPVGIRAGMRQWPAVMRSLASFGVFVTLAAVYLHIHAVVATLLLPLVSVAMVQAALRLFFAAEYLPEAVARWMYPHLARLAHQPTAFAGLAGTGAAWLVGGGSLLALTMMIAAPWLVLALFGEPYTAAVPLLQILAIAVPLRFVSHIYGTALSALDHQRFRVLISAATVAVTVVAEVTLTARFGEIGIVMSLVAGSALLAVGYVTALRRVTPMVSLLPAGAAAAVSALGAIALGTTGQ